MDEYVIKCNKEQLETIMKACEFMSRVQAGQIEEVSCVLGHFADRGQIRDMLIPVKHLMGLDPHASHGIRSSDIPDSSRVLWDVYQVIRNRLAYDDNPGVTPENRFDMGKITVNFDEPLRTDNRNELIKVVRN